MFRRNRRLLSHGLSFPIMGGTALAAAVPAFLLGYPTVCAAAVPPAPVATPRVPGDDTLLGSGAAGPYRLSHAGVVPYSESVTVATVRQLSGIDYTVDPVAGGIVFTHPIKAGDPIAIHYWYNPYAKAPANSPVAAANNLDVPVSGAPVRMVGAYRLSGDGASQGFSSMGMALNQAFGKGGAVGGQLLFSPHAGAIGSDSQSPFRSGESALSLNSHFLLGGLTVGGGWTSAGKAFAGSSDIAADSSAKSWNVAGLLSKGVTLDAASNQKKVGTTDLQRDDHVKVGIATMGGATLALGHTATATGTGATAAVVDATTVGIQDKLAKAQINVDAAQSEKRVGAGTTTKDDSVKVGITTTAGASVAISHTDSKTGAGSSATGADTTEVSIQQRASSIIMLTADANHQESQKPGADTSHTTSSVGVVVTPNKTVTVTLGEHQDRSKGNAGADTHDIKVAVGQAFQAQGALTQSTSDHGAGGTSGNFAVQVQPASGLTVGTTDQFHRDAQGLADHTHTTSATLTSGPAFVLDAKVNEKSTRATGETRGSIISLGLAPDATLGVDLKLDQSVSDKTGIAGTRNFGVQVGPKELRVGATLAEQYQGTQMDSISMVKRNVGASLLMDPDAQFHLAAGFNQVHDSTSVQEQRSLDARVSPFGGVLFTGRYVQRVADGADPPDTASVGLGLHGSKLLGVDASFTQNPDDAKGNLALSLQRSLALQSQLGFLDFTGKYSYLDPAGTGPTVQSREFGMGLRFSRFTRLDSSFQSSSQPLGPDSGLYLYRLGFTHNLGDALSFSLTGQVNTDSAGMAGVKSGLKGNSQAKVGLSARW